MSLTDVSGLDLLEGGKLCLSTINKSSYMDTPGNQNEDPILSVNETARQLGVCRRTLEREVASGKFPPPAKLRGKSIFFLSDVLNYLARLKAQRGGSFAPL